MGSTSGVVLKKFYHTPPPPTPSVDLVAFPGGAVRMKGFISKEIVVLRR